MNLPAWQVMWLLAVAIYGGLKLLTYFTCHIKNVPLWKRMGYLFLWPGMNPKEFYKGTPVPPTMPEWALACFNVSMGCCLLICSEAATIPLLAGWVGMIGLVFILHFGSFHILSLLWRSMGVNATSIMNFPVLSSSLSDFWGKRWNLAFRDLSFRYIFRPLAGSIGTAAATMVVFVSSGLVHDLVISVPCGGGYGGPTLYFVAQGCGLLLDRWLRCGRWLFFVVVLSPLPFLFHEPFIMEAILPTMRAMGLHV